MTNGLDDRKTQFVTYLVYILLALLTVSMGVTGIMLADTLSDQAAQKVAFDQFKETMPEKYVRLERYTCDMQRVESLLGKIDRKLDRLNDGDKQ